MASTTVHALHSGPAAGFDQPFDMLQACHARMERTLALLERLAAHLPQHGCDAQARSAAADVLRYFDIAAPQHHQDEELHVLPRLRAQGQADLAARLLAEHRAMEQAWAQLRPELQAVVTGSLAVHDQAAVQARWAQFASLYRQHLQAEEAQAFVPASSGLSAAQLQAMGEEMARRRGVSAAPR